MLPKHHKFTSPAQFSRTFKGGQRAGSKTVVVHIADDASKPEVDIAQQGGPYFGLIVSKAVGNAVVRHRTSRRLRHVLAGMIPELPATANVVVRALPAAGAASSSELDRDIRSALHRAKKKARR